MTRSSHRPTMPPTFDIVEYARESERIRRNESAEGGDANESPSEVRLKSSPVGHEGEAWAERVMGAPTVVMSPESLKRLPLDHRAGFVLSLMDGSIDLETLLELSGMDRNEVLNLVRSLYDAGVVDFR